MHIVHTFVAGLVLLVGAESVVAGPIWFHYRVDSTANPAPIAGGDFGDFERHNAGQLSAGAPGLIAQFSFLPSSPLPPADWTPTGGGAFDGVTRFAVNVQLTDDLSGETGTVHLTGSATSAWARVSASGALPGTTAFAFDGDFPRTMTLGGRTFDVSATGESDPGGGNVRAFVSIGLEGPSVQQTPEPTTLALAGIGLAGWIGVRRRKGRSSSSPTQCTSPDPDCL